jgi:hypothetical protein
MSEWWTYSLSDFLLFSPQTYYRLFELYNATIWPGQILALAIGAAVGALLWTERPRQARLAFALLAGCWLWVAWAYHLGRYATINWAAVYFAAAFAIQALLLLLVGLTGRFSPASTKGPKARIAFGLLALGLVIQPLIGLLIGRSWSQIEIFGVTPDPTVTTTLGVVLLTSARLRWALLPIPLAWCAVSGATLWTMGSAEFVVLPAAGVLAIAAIMTSKLRD